VNCANCSARKAAISCSGTSRRTATIARHAGAVALRPAFGVNANGIPKRSNVVRHPIAARIGV